MKKGSLLGLIVGIIVLIVLAINNGSARGINILTIFVSILPCVLIGALIGSGIQRIRSGRSMSYAVIIGSALFLLTLAGFIIVISLEDSMMALKYIFYATFVPVIAGCAGVFIGWIIDRKRGYSYSSPQSSEVAKKIPVPFAIYRTPKISITLFIIGAVGLLICNIAFGYCWYNNCEQGILFILLVIMGITPFAVYIFGGVMVAGILLLVGSFISRKIRGLYVSTFHRVSTIVLCILVVLTLFVLIFDARDFFLLGKF